MASEESDSGIQTPNSREEVATTHPLHRSWCFWVLIHSSSAKDNWQHSQKKVHEFTTVEEFWRLFNNIKTPSRLGTIDCSVFKKDVAPAWEDETCKNGGRWIAKIDRMKPQDFDTLWMNLTLTLIGEGLGPQGGCVCGAVVSARNKASKVALWISDSSEEKAMPIGEAYHSILKDAGFGGDIHFENFITSAKSAYTLKGSKRGDDK